MKLRRLIVKNFKLLQDISIGFSTDSQRPLTVIRAENGSGKTSLLYALLWGFYGSKGLPASSQDLGLSPMHWPPDVPCEVSVRIEFQSTDIDTFAGEARPIETRYILTRSATETRRQGKYISRQREELIVYAHSDEGAEKLEDASARALIRRLAPEQLKNIFFTDGDTVQRFITGELGSQARQSAVYESIRSLLGLDLLRTAASDLTKAQKTFKRRLAEAPGGSELKALVEEQERASEERQALLSKISVLQERINNVTEAIERRQAKLFELQGLGDIERIKRQYETAKSTLGSALTQLEIHKKAQRDLMKSEKLSWALMGESLSKGLASLESLAVQGVIPGTSIEVLRDRLILNRCICGESLEVGSIRRKEVERLLAEQSDVDPERQTLTALLHQARPLGLKRSDWLSNNEDWLEDLAAVETARAGVEKQIRDQTEALNECEESLRRLEEAEIDRILDELARDRKQRETFLTDQRGLQIDLDSLQRRITDLEERYKAAQSQVRVSNELRNRVDVTEDLLHLVQQTLETLEGEYLQKASRQMNSLFMQIAGATPEVPRSVFNEVRITADYEIEVLSGGYGRTLDPDFEINGASKRALTLSFIWALMEVAEVSAPRIIDTPLGMTSGGVKTRFVDLLTKPGSSEFQIVLLMTRSEISHVEDLLDERAGVIQTLSCSKDYPVDLLNDWGGDAPCVSACECTHRQACYICARRDDMAHQLAYRNQ